MKKNEKLGAGIISLTIINLLWSLLMGLIGVIGFLFIDMTDAVDTSSEVVIFILGLTLISILGSILILFKRKLGVYLYSVFFIASTFWEVMYGEIDFIFFVMILIKLVYFNFIVKKWYVFK